MHPEMLAGYKASPLLLGEIVMAEINAMKGNF